MISSEELNDFCEKHSFTSDFFNLPHLLIAFGLFFDHRLGVSRVEFRADFSDESRHILVLFAPNKAHIKSFFRSSDSNIKHSSFFFFLFIFVCAFKWSKKKQ